MVHRPFGPRRRFGSASPLSTLVGRIGCDVEADAVAYRALAVDGRTGTLCWGRSAHVAFTPAGEAVAPALHGLASDALDPNDLPAGPCFEPWLGPLSFHEQLRSLGPKPEGLDVFAMLVPKAAHVVGVLAVYSHSVALDPHHERLAELHALQDGFAKQLADVIPTPLFAPEPPWQCVVDLHGPVLDVVAPTSSAVLPSGSQALRDAAQAFLLSDAAEHVEWADWRRTTYTRLPSAGTPRCVVKSDPMFPWRRPHGVGAATPPATG